MTRRLKGLAQCMGAAVLPNDRRIHGHAGCPVPNNRCLALIGDTNGANLIGAQIRAAERAINHLEHRLPDFLRIVLNPAIFRKILRELLLTDPNNLAVLIKYHGTRAGGALVNGKNIVRHG